MPAALKRKRGSMIVEAAIVLPIYVIAVVTLCWLVKACFLETAVFNTVCDQVHQASVSVTKSAGISGKIRSALDDSGVEGSEYRHKGIARGIPVEGFGGFEKLRYSYDTRIRVPVPFVKEIKLENEVLYHAWTGYSPGGPVFPFSRMESDGDGSPVIVFPRTGGRYHDKSCRYVNACPSTVTLTSSVRRKYDRCRLCTEGNEADGQTVYIFKYGGSYHESDCSAVDRFTMTMDTGDAEKKGYTPCSICGG